MKKDVLVAFGNVVRNLRENQGLSQRMLAEKTAFHRTYISKLENGQKDAFLSTLFRLADGLNIGPVEMTILLENELGKRSCSDRY